MSFNSKLIDLLKTDHNLVDDEGELLIAAVQDRAWKIDRDLVKLLLSDKDIKAKFFDEIEGDALSESKGYWIFNINTFLEYISQKNFLDNSYTRFRNRIGLTIGEKYLRERGEVALVWAYKDTILEGGQTKEEEKRKEIFFNEMLAQDEINRLLDPKVLTDFTRYTAKGKQPVKEFKRDENGVIRENLILKGNNLLTLHALKTQFRRQVKLIYIDPPYNTGGDGFKYNDNFNHSTWLTFVKNRLEIARQLLRDDGSIWINIDDNESHYLKVVCDEIFGRDNFVTTVTWEKKVSPSNDATWFSGDHDYILIYAKSKINWQVNRLPMTAKQKNFYKNPDNDPRGNWNSATYTCNKSKSERPNLYYPIKNPNTGEMTFPSETAVWAYSKDKHKEHIRDNMIYWGKDGKARMPRLKKFISQAGDVVPRTIWNYSDVGHTQEAKQEIMLLADDEIFATPKPERLLHRIIHIATNENDLVLDFFAGSGTTAAVAHKMKRQFIAVEQMNYAETITLPRVMKVIGNENKKKGKMFDEIEFDNGGISELVNWQGGGDFIYCEMMKYNEAFMERIQAAKTSNALLKIWQEMSENSFLNWYVNPEMPEEAVKDFEAIGKTDNGFEKQKKLLAELLDKNQLYVNLSEIDDTQYKVSKEDKALNKAFYGEA